MAEDHVRNAQRRRRGRRRPTPDGHTHLPVAAAQRSRVSHGCDSRPSSASSCHVTAVEVGNPLNCYEKSDVACDTSTLCRTDHASVLVESNLRIAMGSKVRNLLTVQAATDVQHQTRIAFEHCLNRVRLPLTSQTEPIVIRLPY